MRRTGAILPNVIFRQSFFFFLSFSRHFKFNFDVQVEWKWTTYAANEIIRVKLSDIFIIIIIFMYIWFSQHWRKRWYTLYVRYAIRSMVYEVWNKTKYRTERTKQISNMICDVQSVTVATLAVLLVVYRSFVCANKVKNVIHWIFYYTRRQNS